MVAQVSIHEPAADNGQRNPHAHLLLTMREVNADGFGKKNRDWNGGWMAEGTPNGGALKGWRAMIADHTNEALEKAGHDARVDARSFKDMGVEKVPSVHQGKEATALKRKGERTRRGDKQRVAQVLNASLASDKVQRAPSEEGSGSQEHGRREIYEQTRRERDSPLREPPAPHPGWNSGKGLGRQKDAERE
jgi:hypothetical protein